ncbi:hypothetical protein [Hanstruepera ponticola]|uniref:hypothetical protein n=1 Tax=Hanstruepera ponticola TaxID=2042995 RepID=UPI00293BDC3D|nr:hypothetical protein [Hanstruepera ponticola]
MMNQFKILIFASMLFLFNCSKDDDSQVISPEPNLQLAKTYGGTKNESAQSIAKTNDGGYVILGYSQSNDGDITDKTNESFDYWVLKFDMTHNLQWSKTYGGTGDDRGHAIIQTQDGGYAILGYSTSNDLDVTDNAGAQDYWISKLDTNGNITWQKSFGYTGSDIGFTLIQTNDSGYFITGVLDVTASGGEGNTRVSGMRHAGGDYWAIKLDASGNREWSKYYGGGFTDTPYDAIQTADNGYIIVGSSDSNDVDIQNNIGTYDFWVIKISETGTLIWERSYGGTEIDEARGIVDSGDGNYLITGDTRSSDFDVSSNNGAADLWLIKISPSGDLIWEKTFGGSSFDVARSIQKSNDKFIISGSSRSANGDVSSNQGQNDAWVIEVGSSGNLISQKTVGGSEIDFSYDATKLEDNTIIAVGESSSSDGDIEENKGFTDLLIIKMK